ncbi:hypothetical protein [Polaribacter ponticola]|uniref:DUF4252 domain-containing protein n=1 Tax=Polaribacter ponticola TaxID=2978475 RepID=A0ABT5SC11_9FLAO|nr:hypothetical protein [Polaribacter sp. MSW5]MDD7915638.1 hypothetical protein [Polaribacter sp. MSW5]
MKSLFIILILFFSVNLFSQNISGKVTYVLSLEPIQEKKIDSMVAKSDFKNAKMEKMMRDIFKNTPDVNAYLEFNNQKSIYFVEDKMEVDGKAKLNMNRVLAGGDNKIYKNIKTKEYLKENLRENLLIEKKRKNGKLLKNQNR